MPLTRKPKRLLPLLKLLLKRRLKLESVNNNKKLALKPLKWLESKPKRRLRRLESFKVLLKRLPLPLLRNNKLKTERPRLRSRKSLLPSSELKKPLDNTRSLRECMPLRSRSKRTSKSLLKSTRERLLKALLLLKKHSSRLKLPLLLLTIKLLSTRCNTNKLLRRRKMPKRRLLSSVRNLLNLRPPLKKLMKPSNLPTKRLLSLSPRSLT